MTMLPCLLASLAADLAKPAANGTQLASSPSVWITQDFLEGAHIDGVLGMLPTTESAWTPCIGQVSEFRSKRCTTLPVGGDADGALISLIERVERTFGVDATALKKGGLPIIRYLPGAPPVGVHGDIGHDGLVPNATLILYLTDSEHDSGKTWFPLLRGHDGEDGLSITPKRGQVLSFTNVNADGHAEPKAKHGVSAVSQDAKGDRFVVQIPVLHVAGEPKPRAYPKHVSGTKAEKHARGEHGSSSSADDKPSTDASSNPFAQCLKCFS